MNILKIEDAKEHFMIFFNEKGEHHFVKYLPKTRIDGIKRYAKRLLETKDSETVVQILEKEGLISIPTEVSARFIIIK